MGERKRAGARAILIAAALALVAPGGAQAIIEGGPSGLGAHVVKVLSGGVCSGVAIGRQAVVTAGHCAHGATVVVDGLRIRVAQVVRSAVIDGRRVSVSGDAAILILREPLPPAISPIPVGDARTDGPFTIAGFGTASEAHRMATGALREARLVQGPGRFQLVDPNRSGKISASACYGDSGGAVIQNGVLVGVITRANYPRLAIACGFYTQYAPIVASGPAVAPTPAAAATTLATVTDQQPRTRYAQRAREPVIDQVYIAARPEAFPLTLVADDKAKIAPTRKWRRR